MQLEQKKRRLTVFEKNQRKEGKMSRSKQRPNQDKEPEKGIRKNAAEKLEYLRDKEPDIEIRKNLEEKLEHLVKQEKYHFGLNGNFRQDKGEIERGLIMREQRQEMMIQVVIKDGERMVQYYRDKESAYIVPAIKRNGGLRTISLNRESSKDHQFQETHRNRRSQIVSAIM